MSPPYFNLPRPNLNFNLLGRGSARETEGAGAGPAAVVVDDEFEVQPRAAAAAVNPEMIERRPRGQEVAEEALSSPPRQPLPPPPPTSRQQQPQEGSPFSRVVPRFSHFFASSTASSVSWTSRRLSRSTGSHYPREDDAPGPPYARGREEIESPKTPRFRIAEQELPSTRLHLPQLARTWTHGSNGPPTQPGGSHEHRPPHLDYDMSSSSDEDEDESSQDERPDDIESHRTTEPRMGRASSVVAAVEDVEHVTVPPPAVPADQVRTGQSLGQRLGASRITSLFRGDTTGGQETDLERGSRRRQPQQERQRARRRRGEPPAQQQSSSLLSSSGADSSNPSGSGGSREDRRGGERRKKKRGTRATLSQERSRRRRHADGAHHRHDRERRERRGRPAIGSGSGSGSRSGSGATARRAPPKRFMYCFPWVKSRRARNQILRCCVSGLLLVLLLTVYLALSISRAVNSSEFTVIFILVILAVTIFFCHGLIRLCMRMVGRGAGKNVSSRDGGDGNSSGSRGAQLPAVYGSGGYAIPRRPIRVVLARDEEAAGIESETATIKPPAYGLWRESVRVDPNRIYWQRADAPPLPQHSSSGASRASLDVVRGDSNMAVASGANGLSSSSPSSSHPYPSISPSSISPRTDSADGDSRPTTPRPPSYVSDDGISYVVDAQPRSIAPSEAEVVQVPGRPLPAGVGAVSWNYPNPLPHQHQHQQQQRQRHPSELGRAGAPARW